MNYSAVFSFLAFLTVVDSNEIGGRDRVFGPNIHRVPVSRNPAPPTTTTTTPTAGQLGVFASNDSDTYVPTTKAEQDFLVLTCFDARFYKIGTSNYYDCSSIYQAPSSKDTQEAPQYLEMRQKYALMVAQFTKQQANDAKRVKNCLKAFRNGNLSKKNCREFLVFPKFEIPRTPRETLRKEAFDNLLRGFCSNEQNMRKTEEALCRDFNLKRVYECLFTPANSSKFCQLVLNGPEDHYNLAMNHFTLYLGKLHDLSKQVLQDPWMQ